MLADELYNAMLEAGHKARREKIHGPLAHTMIDMVQNSLKLWRRDEKTAMHFAVGVTVGPTNLRATTGQLPWPVWLPHVGGLPGCCNTSQISM